MSLRQKKNSSPTSHEADLLERIQEKENIIHELKDLIQTISRGKYMWESTFDAIKDPVVIISEDFLIQRANRAAAQAAKMDVRLMINKKCHEALAGSATPCRGCPLASTLDTRVSHSSDLDRFKKSNRQYQAYAYPLSFESNFIPAGASHQTAPRQAAPRQAVLHYRDITEERQLQHKLFHSEKMAAIGTLAGGVAHEINNPLGGILAFTQLVMRDLHEQHPNYADLKEIEESTLRCKKIVQDLLDFSRQSREETRVPLQLNDVLQKMMPLIQVQAKTSQVKVECEFDKNLPLILGNDHKLQQVFLNLITNAYHAMPQGGLLRFRTYQGLADDRVYAEVSDMGIGIKEEDLGKIFDPYFTTKEQGEGTGLGLSITYGIVREYDGTIDVKSIVGSGTTFILSFPSTQPITRDTVPRRNYASTNSSGR